MVLRENNKKIGGLKKAISEIDENKFKQTIKHKQNKKSNGTTTTVTTTNLILKMFSS